LIGVPLGVTDVSGLSAGPVAVPPSPAPLFLRLDFSIAFEPRFWGLVHTFLFLEIFDGPGSFLGLFTVMGKDGEACSSKFGKALIVDSAGVAFGA
jgi:AGZA family xanthine/uracil permease-like MFS transporter